MRPLAPRGGLGEKFQRVEEEGMHGDGKLDKLDSFFVFVVSLGGSSVQVRVEGSDSYESLAAKVAAKVNIHECHWYLTFSGKDLRHVLRPTSVLHCDSTIRIPLLENGSVQHVIEEDAGLLVELASVAWHRGKASFAQSQSVPHGTKDTCSTSWCQCPRCQDLLSQWQSKAASVFFQSLGCHFDS